MKRPKHTFSKTLKSSGWNNSIFHNDINTDTVQKIKAGLTGDIVVLGSGEVSMELHRQGFIDQYNIILDPRLGMKGKRFFDGISPTSLELVQAKTFRCGVVFLQYKVLK